MKTFIVQSSVALVLSLAFQCSRSLAADTNDFPRQKTKIQYIWIVDGAEYQSKMLAVVAAARGHQNIVRKCQDIPLEKLVK